MDTYEAVIQERAKDFKEEKVQESKFIPDKREITKKIYVHNKLKTRVRLLYTVCTKKKFFKKSDKNNESSSNYRTILLK